MPVTPRAAAKRRRAEIGRENGRQIAMELNSVSPLLTLSGEVRNRIYDYVTTSNHLWKDAYAPLIAPLSGKKSGETPKRPDNWMWTSFAFTQTCKQIRSEYRPIWLRSSDIRIQYHDVDRFLSTFYVSPPDMQNGPMRLQISWAGEMRNDNIIDILPLLRLAASGSSGSRASIMFIPHVLAEGLQYRKCWPCGRLDDDPDYYEFEVEVPCRKCAYFRKHDDLNALNKHEHLSFLNGVLESNNKTWRTAIREGNLAAVTYSLRFRKPLKMRIDFAMAGAPAYLNWQNMSQGAMRFVREAGLEYAHNRGRQDKLLYEGVNYLEETQHNYKDDPVYEYDPTEFEVGVHLGARKGEEGSFELIWLPACEEWDKVK
ncbi:hypothetical protein BDV95DRAFT_595933 [Massariosphaeria phaeospora]|uniref:F-box domain-containing protein n=1 Tax=Massariosphaeria phaeospora TaxID=100035 RepID=A0A7C8I7X3_9PLEO|nr:hypothetical protein BDV95DRAFT_595933 [Massariosphaeria phaeospora]